MVILLDLVGRNEDGLDDVFIAHVADDGGVLDFVAVLFQGRSARVHRSDKGDAVAAVILADDVVDPFVDVGIGNKATGGLEVLDDEFALDQGAQDVQLGFLDALEKLLAGEALTQHLFGFRHLLIDLDVGDDLVIDYSGNTVGQQLGPGGRREQKAQSRPNNDVDGDE